MSIQFGVGTLKVLENLKCTGCAVTTAAVSGAPIHNLAITSGEVVIDGVTAVVSANANLTWTETSMTGVGLLVYAYIASTDTITATVAVAASTASFNVVANFPTAICPLYKMDYGTAAGAIAAGSLIAFSGGTATKTIAKVQNVSIPISYEIAQMRGGADVFPCDTKFFDGKCEGNFELADQTAQQMLFFGGVYASAGNTSGSWTLSGNSYPNAVSLVFQNTTDGKTATYTIMRAYLTQNNNDFARTEFLQPTYNFVTQANNQGTVLKIAA